MREKRVAKKKKQGRHFIRSVFFLFTSGVRIKYPIELFLHSATQNRRLGRVRLGQWRGNTLARAPGKLGKKRFLSNQRVDTMMFF